MSSTRRSRATRHGHMLPLSILYSKTCRIGDHLSPCKSYLISLYTFPFASTGSSNLFFSMLRSVFKALVGRDDDPDEPKECDSKIFKSINDCDAIFSRLHLFLSLSWSKLHSSASRPGYCGDFHSFRSLHVFGEPVPPQSTRPGPAGRHSRAWS
jgi:hypothetical protein